MASAFPTMAPLIMTYSGDDPNWGTISGLRKKIESPDIPDLTDITSTPMISMHLAFVAGCVACRGRCVDVKLCRNDAGFPRAGNTDQNVESLEQFSMEVLLFFVFVSLGEIS